MKLVFSLSENFLNNLLKLDIYKILFICKKHTSVQSLNSFFDKSSSCTLTHVFSNSPTSPTCLICLSLRTMLTEAITVKLKILLNE